jgi:hypothetical protein
MRCPLIVWKQVSAPTVDTCSGRSLSYAELTERAQATAGRLTAAVEVLELLSRLLASDEVDSADLSEGERKTLVALRGRASDR